MLSYIIRRLAIAVPTLILVSIFVFTLQQLLPGDPALVMAGEERDPASIEFIREKYHLNEPIYVQYAYWMKAVLQGDMGVSLRTGQPVLGLIANKLPVTIQLAIMALVIAFVIGVPAGILSAVKKGTAIDYAANVVALSGLSVPNFWLGIMLILLVRSEEHTSELQSLMRISYAVFCLKKKTHINKITLNATYIN